MYVTYSTSPGPSGLCPERPDYKINKDGAIMRMSNAHCQGLVHRASLVPRMMNTTNAIFLSLVAWTTVFYTSPEHVETAGSVVSLSGRALSVRIFRLQNEI